MATQVTPRRTPWRRVAAVLSWAVLVAVACAGALLFASAVVYLLRGAGNVALGGPAFFPGAARYVAVVAAQVGLLVGVAIATAWYRRSVWSVLRNTAVALWVFVVFDVVLSNPYSGVPGITAAAVVCAIPLAVWLARRTLASVD